MLLLALDWAALHDIVKGEADLRAEYAMLVFSGVALGVLIGAWWRRRGHKPSGA